MGEAPGVTSAATIRRGTDAAGARVPRAVLAAAAVALALRVLWILSTDAGHVIFSKYFFLGRKLAELGWVPGVALTSSPLYTYLVGFFHVVLGFDETRLRLVQALAAAAAVVAAGLAARRLAGPRAAAVTAFVLALYPSLVLYDTEPQTVVWENLFNGACLWLLLRSQATGNRGETALAGLCFGLSALLRPNILLWAAALALWLYLSSRSPEAGASGDGPPPGPRAPLVPLAWFFVAAACAILPVTWVNSRADGGIILVTASGGSTFYGGNNRGTDGLFFQPPAANIQLQLSTPDSALRDVITAEHLGFRTLAERVQGRRLSAREASDFWLGESLSWIRRQPRRFAGLLAAKARLFFTSYESHDIGSAFSRGLPLQLPQTVAFALVWPLGLLGLGLSLPLWRRWLPVQALFAVFLATTVLFYVNARLRLPTVLPLALAAGLAVAQLATWARERRTAALLRSGAFVLAAAALCLLPNARAQADATRSRAFFLHFQRGRIAALAGRTDDAATAFAAAVALNPELASSVLGLLDSLPQNPAWEPMRRAAAAAAAAATRRPEPPDRAEREAAALDASAYSLLIARRYPEAVEVFGRAAAIDPGNPEPFFGRANALAYLGRWPEALADYERAFERGRKFENRLEELYLTMGRVAIQAGDREKAATYLRRALFVAPDLAEARRLLALLAPG